MLLQLVVVGIIAPTFANVNMALGSTISSGREPKSCSGQVFNFKLDLIGSYNVVSACNMPHSRVENVLSSQLLFVYDSIMLSVVMLAVIMLTDVASYLVWSSPDFFCWTF